MRTLDGGPPMNGKADTVLLLAAGSGSRLKPMTNDQPKCLTEINGVPILKRLVRSLRQQGFRRLIAVVGHLDHCVRKALEEWGTGLSVEYVVNPHYQTTNNIYSLWLARRSIREPFLLVECDLVFDPSKLREMREPDRIAVSPMRPWMRGSTVNLDPSGNVIGFRVGQRPGRQALDYKTVNMYSLSIGSWRKAVRRIRSHIAAGGLNDYYETIFAEMVDDGSLSLQAVSFDPDSWYEVDTVTDLHEAERLFSERGFEEILQ